VSSRRQPTEQRRAAAAWLAVNNVNNADKSEYKSRARGMAAMIQTNGLGATMAFLLAKSSKRAYKQAYEHISEWVTADKQLGYSGDLMDLIRNADVDVYRRATTEAIAYSIWLKRYVESWTDVAEAED
jgi:CRISPR-associated protein Cmr5